MKSWCEESRTWCSWKRTYASLRTQGRDKCSSRAADRSKADDGTDGMRQVQEEELLCENADCRMCETRLFARWWHTYWEPWLEEQKMR
jgi:hypothetical protein